MSVEETLESRNPTHGDYTEQSTIHANLLAVIEPYMGKLRPSHKQALIVITLKISRILAGNQDHEDHWHDIAGYATLGEERCIDPNQTELDIG